MTYTEYKKRPHGLGAALRLGAKPRDQNERLVHVELTGFAATTHLWIAEVAGFVAVLDAIAAVGSARAVGIATAVSARVCRRAIVAFLAVVRVDTTVTAVGSERAVDITAAVTTDVVVSAEVAGFFRIERTVAATTTELTICRTAVVGIRAVG